MPVDLTEMFPDERVAEGEVRDEDIVLIRFGVGTTPMRMRIDKMANCLDKLRREQQRGARHLTDPTPGTTV